MWISQLIWYLPSEFSFYSHSVFKKILYWIISDFGYYWFQGWQIKFVLVLWKYISNTSSCELFALFERFVNSINNNVLSEWACLSTPALHLLQARQSHTLNQRHITFSWKSKCNYTELSDGSSDTILQIYLLFCQQKPIKFCEIVFCPPCLNCG